MPRPVPDTRPLPSRGRPTALPLQYSLQCAPCCPLPLPIRTFVPPPSTFGAWGPIPAPAPSVRRIPFATASARRLRPFASATPPRIASSLPASASRSCLPRATPRFPLPAVSRLLQPTARPSCARPPLPASARAAPTIFPGSSVLEARLSQSSSDPIGSLGCNFTNTTYSTLNRLKTIFCCWPKKPKYSAEYGRG